MQKIRVRVAGLLVQNDKVLMVCHKKKEKKYWLLPGGGVNLGESLTEALVREFKEELDIEVEAKDIVYISDSISPHGKRHIINIVFSCEYVSGKYSLGSDKRLHDYSFFLPGELDDLIIYPSFRKELKTFIESGSVESVYLGSFWNT